MASVVEQELSQTDIRPAARPAQRGVRIVLLLAALTLLGLAVADWKASSRTTANTEASQAATPQSTQGTKAAHTFDDASLQSLVAAIAPLAPPQYTVTGSNVTTSPEACTEAATQQCTMPFGVQVVLLDGAGHRIVAAAMPSDPATPGDIAAGHPTARVATEPYRDASMIVYDDTESSIGIVYIFGRGLVVEVGSSGEPRANLRGDASIDTLRQMATATYDLVAP